MSMGPLEYQRGSLNCLPRGKVLLGIRIIWFALVMGQLAFMAVIFLVILPHTRKPLHPQPDLGWVSFVLLATIIPIAFVVRRLIHKRSADGVGIPPAAYSTGNIVFWAACEGCAFFGLIAIMLNASIWPAIVAVAIALFLQALTFPTGAGISFSNETGVPGNG